VKKSKLFSILSLVKKYERIYAAILVSRIYSTIITTAALSFHAAIKVWNNYFVYLLY
jgi:hypothetical protein